MLEKEIILAKKYAVAYLAEYVDEYSSENIAKLQELKDFFVKNKLFYISLRIPSISIESKISALKKVTSKFNLPSSLNNLMRLLLKHRRIDILNTVLSSIWDEYKKINRIVELKIFSSHKLCETDKNIIKNLISNKLLKTTNKKIALTNFKIDPSMIVGLRIEGNRLLWERSIRKELIIIGKSIEKEGIPCK